MKEQSANKLDKLFKEKLQHAEISPEDNYWPFIEQKINKPSFLKFGWRHINIYNLSVGLLLLLVSILYFFKSQPKENKLPTTSPIEETTSSFNQIEITKQDDYIPVDRLNSKKEIKTNSTPTTLSTIKIVDSTVLAPTNILEKPTPVIIPDSAVTKPVEKKKKPKEIIYIIQQDTIIEKDTVKVRRLRKK